MERSPEEFYKEINSILSKMKMKPLTQPELVKIHEALDRLLPYRGGIADEAQALDDLKEAYIWLFGDILLNNSISESFEAAFKVWSHARCSRNCGLSIQLISEIIREQEEEFAFTFCLRSSYNGLWLKE